MNLDLSLFFTLLPSEAGKKSYKKNKQQPHLTFTFHPLALGADFYTFASGIKSPT